MTPPNAVLPLPHAADGAHRLVAGLRRLALRLVTSLLVTLLSACGDDDPEADVLGATAPGILTQPASVTVQSGAAASFSVAVTGTAPITYQWQRNGVDIAGATAASYTTGTTVAADDGAKFSVVVDNAANAPVRSAEAVLTVGTADVAVQITAQPGNASVNAGQAASFTVVAVGTSPQYQWQRDGAPLAGATSPTYTLANATLADSGARFSVVVGNAVNSVTSSVATLTVGAATIAPSITTQPADQSVTAPATASFGVSTTGTAPFTYQWRKNGTAIGGATAAVYTTPATATADDGALYSVLVANGTGSATSRDARLTVADAVLAPSLTTQPADATATVGQTVTFATVAAGTGPLAYQWRRNGTAITGATAASYTTPAVATGDNGALFTVVVSNGQGNVTSRPALLTVTTAPHVMSGRAWAAAQSLEENSTAASVPDRSSTIDDAGRVTVIFRKNDGSRDALYAVRGMPNGPGQAPTWSTPVLIDLQGTTAVSNMAAGVQMSVTAAPGGDVVALWNHFAPCSATTYGSAPFQCRYYYLARYRLASGTWDAPTLLTDTPDGAFTTFVNDRGDTVFLGNSWVPYGSLRSTPVKAVFMKTAAESGFRRQLLSSEPTTAFTKLQMDLDARGNLLLATQFVLNGVSEIVAYRGTAAAGLGSPFQLDTLAAPAVLQQTRVGLNGQQVVVWYHPDVGANRYAAASADPGAGFTVTDLGANSPGEVLSVTDAGTAILCNTGCRFRQTWTTSGGWTPSTFTGALFFTHDDNARNTAVSRNGDLLWVDGVGTSATYDSVLNAAVIANDLAVNQRFVLGLANGSAGYAKPLLSTSGIGFVDMLNSYDVLPTPAAPAGAVRAGVDSLWGAFLK